MPIRCSNCGADNRDAAKFCNVCGGQLSSPGPKPPPPRRTQSKQSQQSPPAQSRSNLPVPRPKRQLPAQPASSSLAQKSQAASGAGIFKSGPEVDGKVTDVSPERQEKPPFDPARAMVMLSVLVFLIAGFAIGAAFSLALWIALLIVGIGSLGCLFPVLMAPIYFIIGPIIRWIRGEQSILVLNFQVLDHLGGRPIDVVLYRKPGGGNVRQGDKVKVHGDVQRGSNIIHAHRVQVYESRGRPTDYSIEAMRPWPIWIGLLALGGTAAILWYLVNYFG